MSTIKSLRFDISSGWDGAGVTKAREDIAALKRDLDELNGRDVRARITVDVQGADAARATLDDIARARTATVRTDLQGADAARATLDGAARTRTATVRAQDEGVDALRAKLDELARLRTARINANLAGDDAVRARLDQLIHTRTAEIKADLRDMGVAQRLDVLSRDRHARIIVDVDKSKLDELSKSLDTLNQKFAAARTGASNLALGIIGLAPAIVPLTAAILGLGGAVVSSFGSAAIAVAPFAASIVGTYKSSSQLATTINTLQDHMALLRQEAAAGMNVHKQMATTQLQINQAMKDATPVQRQVAQSILNMKDSWQKFQVQAEKFTGPVLAAGFSAISGAISHMLPLVKAVAPIFQEIADKANTFANSNGMTKFVDWIVKVGVPNLKNIVATIGHLFVTIGQIIKAFAGNGLGFSQWLSDVTKKLNDWGKAGGFQRFADKVKQDWPMVKQLLMAAGDAIKHIVQALAGLGPASVSGLTLILQAISKLSPGQLQALAVAFVAFRTALMGIQAVQAVIGVIRGIATAITFLRDAMAAARLVAIAFEISLAPMLGIIALVIAVVVALGIVIYLMITHWKEFSSYISGSFMSAVHTVWNALKQFGDWIKTGLSKVWDGIKAAWSATWSGLQTAWKAVASSFTSAWNAASGALKTAWSATWNFLKSTGSTIWNGIKAAWSAVAHGLGTAWTATSGALKTAWSATWNGMKTAGSTIWGGMKTAWHATASGFSTAWNATSSALKSAWSATWNFLKSTAETIWNGIKTGLSHFFAWMTPFGKSHLDTIHKDWENFKDKILKTIGDWAIKAVAAVAKFFSQLGKDFAKGLKDLGQLLLKGAEEVAKFLMDGLIKGLEHGIGGVLGKVADIGKKVLGGFKSIFKIFSPSMETHQMGLDLHNGLGGGLTAGSVISITAAIKVATNVINSLKTAFRNMSQVGIEAMQLLDSGFKAGMMILQVTVQQFGPKITASFKTTFAQLKTTVTQTMTEVNAAVKTGMTQMHSSITTGLNTIKSAWAAAWTALKATATTAWNAIKAAWTVFVKTFQTAWTTAATALKAKWTTDWTALKTSGQTAWDAIKTAWTTFTKTFQTLWTTAFNTLKAQWTTDWTALKTAGQTIWDAMKTAWTKFGTDLNTAWKTASTTLQAAWKTAWTNMNSTAKSEWATITTTIGTAVNKIIGIVNSLIKAWNAVASAVSLPSISAVSPASFAEGGIVKGYAEGGVVGHIGVNMAGGGVLGGYEPGHDSVPAMLSKGEGVLVPEAVRGLGESFVHGANHHFSGGRAGSAGGFSGGRQHFAAGGIAGGVATGAFGLPDPNAVKAMFDPLIAQLRAINGWSHGAGAKFGDVGQKMEDKLIQAIQAKIAAMMAAMAAAAAAAGGKGTAVSGKVGNLSALALKALLQAGIPASQLANFLKRIMIESSGNPNAINNWDINAKNGIPSQGLGQIIPPNFAKYHAAGTSGNILDPTANLYASANYIKAVYGGNVPTGAAYANGTGNAARGWALVGEEGPEMVNFGGGEKVLTAEQTNKAISGGGGGGGTVINVSIDARGSTPESVDKLKSEAIPQLRMALQAGVGKKGR